MLRMDDYNLGAKTYWWITTTLGAVAIALAILLGCESSARLDRARS